MAVAAAQEMVWEAAVTVTGAADSVVGAMVEPAMATVGQNWAVAQVAEWS